MNKRKSKSEARSRRAKSAASASAQQQAGSSGSLAVHAADPNRSPALLSDWLLLAATCLFCCRLFLPTESAADGDTAFIVLAWTVLTSVITWQLWRNPGGPQLRFDRVDLLLAIVCFSPLLATLALVWTGGQLRTALNMSWEWIGCFLAVFWLRQLSGFSRSRFAFLLIVGCGIVLSWQGIYQNQVQLPQQRADVLPLIENWQHLELQADQPRSKMMTRRFEEKQRAAELELIQSGIPVDRRAQQMFVERLNSSEPFGSFALANSFAGLLLVCLLLMCGLALGRNRDADSRHNFVQGWLLVAGMMIVVAYCLLLTKSRTAWIGTIAGFAIIVLGLISQGRRSGRFTWKILLSVVAVTVGLSGLAVVFGQVDLEVLTEAPKSLRYRGEYWLASWQMLQDHWLFGVGPGNFRQNYLAYKLPQSSEEILDPHNFWLDAWAGGGIIAVLAWLGLSVMFTQRLWNRLVRIPTASDSQPRQIVMAVETKLLLIGAFAAVICAGLLGGAGITPYLEQLLLMGGLLAVVCLLLQKSVSVVPVIRVGSLAAAVGLAVHLCGAGGYSMPALFQLLVLTMFVLPDWDRPKQVGWIISQRGLLAGILGGLVLSGIGCWAVILPELAAIRSQADVMNARSQAQVESSLKDWTQADSLSPDPWLQLGNLHLNMLETMGENKNRTTEFPMGFARGAVEKSTDNAVVAFKNAIQRNPADYYGYQQLAKTYFLAAKTEANAVEQLFLLENGLRFQRLALARYPNDLQLWAELAQMLALAGEREQLQQALQTLESLQNMTMQAGHTDRLLDAEQLERLRKL